MTFDQAIKFVLRFEGGYANDPDDPGGETNFGLSKKTYPNLDIKALTEEAAKLFYRNDYWVKMRCDELPKDLRLMVFDCAVNQGISRATRMLQGAVGAKQDGLMGPITVAASREIPVGLALSNMALLRHTHYTRLPHWPKFGAGWSKRLLQVVLETIEII
jgi:lysozyme family protein